MRSKALIEREIAETEAHLVDLREELAKWDRKVSRTRSDSYHKRKVMLEASAPLMEDRIEVGDLIEVTGAKSGKYKRVVKLTRGRLYGSKFHCGVVHGSSVYYKRERDYDKTGNITVLVEDVTKITDHGTNKVVALLKSGTSEWIKAKELVDNDR